MLSHEEPGLRREVSEEGRLLFNALLIPAAVPDPPLDSPHNRIVDPWAPPPRKKTYAFSSSSSSSSGGGGGDGGGGGGGAEQSGPEPLSPPPPPPLTPREFQRLVSEKARRLLILALMKPPHAFVCPITLELMSDPVVLSDGHT